MVPIAYASSKGSDEPAHLRKIPSAFTAHIHNEGACRGCEFNFSKAVEMIVTSRNSLYLPHVCRSMYPDFVTCEAQPAHHTILSAPLFLKQNIKHFVGQCLGPNCLLNWFVTASFFFFLWGGGCLLGPTLDPALLIVSAADKGTG